MPKASIANSIDVVKDSKKYFGITITDKLIPKKILGLTMDYEQVYTVEIDKLKLKGNDPYYLLAKALLIKIKKVLYKNEKDN